jgi:glyoxylase I family protein
MTPTTTGASHVALTVRDLDASTGWYERVLGWRVLTRLDATQAGSPRVLLYDPATGFAVALCRPADGSGDVFDHRRTWLDHLALRVADDATLDAWLAHLDDCGIAHSPVREAGLGRLVSFEDPDGIALELWADAR